METPSALARGRRIIAKGSSLLRTSAPPGAPASISTRPRRTEIARPTHAREIGAQPNARAARNSGARGGRGPAYQVSPAAKRTSASPGRRASKTTAIGAVLARWINAPPRQTASAAAAKAAAARRLGSASSAPSPSA